MIHILIAGSIIALEVQLQNSLAYQGLAEVPDAVWLHYAWTTGPAAILALLSLWLSSISFETRLLTPYLLLDETTQPHTCLQLDLLRPLIPIMLLQQFRNRNFVGMAATIAASIASIYTVPSASLFRISSVPVNSSATLHLTSAVLANVDLGHVGNAAVSSLILETNLSYSNQQYENLVIPYFSLDGFTAQNTSQDSADSSISISAIVPTLRPGLSCHFLPQSAFASSFDMPSNLIMVTIRPICQPRYSVQFPVPNEVPGTWASGMFFGISNSFYVDTAGLCNGTFFSIWGYLSKANDSSSISTSVMECTTILETVDTAVYFRGPELSLDLSHPPKAVDSTASVIWNSSLNLDDATKAAAPDYVLGLSGGPMKWAVETFGNYLNSLPPPNNTMFDAFFEQLVTSRYAIPLELIGNQSQAEIVRKAISFQYGIIIAQAIANSSVVSLQSSEGRNQSMVKIPLSLSNTSHPSNTSHSDDMGVYPAAVTDPYGGRRLVQDPISTRVLESMLLASLVISLSGWVLSPRRAVLRRSPTNIASVLALLAGGDVLEYLATKGEEAWADGTCGFRLGWGPEGVSKGDGQRFGIWTVKDWKGKKQDGEKAVRQKRT